MCLEAAQLPHESTANNRDEQATAVMSSAQERERCRGREDLVALGSSSLPYYYTIGVGVKGWAGVGAETETLRRRASDRELPLFGATSFSSICKDGFRVSGIGFRGQLRVRVTARRGLGTCVCVCVCVCGACGGAVHMPEPAP